MRARVASIAATIGHDLADIPLQFVTVPQLLLDSAEGQDLLRRCVRHVGPKLLVIDPFVRVTMSDENSASGVGEVLQFLRGVQREFGTAVLLVHHMRKGGGNMRPGQALRGSGDLHAFGDSNLYLARSGESVFLTAEQRGAEGFESLELELRGEGEKMALHALEFRAQTEEASVGAGAKRSARKSKRDVVAEVQALIVASEAPLQQRAIRERLGCRMVAVSEALQRLEAQGMVGRGDGGYQALGE